MKSYHSEALLQLIAELKSRADYLDDELAAARKENGQLKEHVTKLNGAIEELATERDQLRCKAAEALIDQDYKDRQDGCGAPRLDGTDA